MVDMVDLQESLTLVQGYAQAHPFLTVALGLPFFIVLSVVLNVARQFLVPKDPSLPPEVFHYFPIIGSTISYGMDPYKFFSTCQKQYGNIFTFVLLGKNVTVALSPDGTSLILNGRLSQVNAELEYTNLTTPVFGEGVVYDCPNSLLMEQKRFMKDGLTIHKFRHYVGIIHDEVQLALKQDVFKSSPNKGEFEPAKFAAELIICTAAASLQGPEVREGLDKTFAHLYHDLDAGFTPLHHILPGLPLPSYRKRDEAQRKMARFYMDIIEKRRESGVEMQDMLSSLVGSTYKDGTEVTDRDVAHMMIALLMGGQHTSSATVSWALSEIGMRPDLQKELYAELERHGRDSDGSWKPLTYDMLQECILLQATIKETLRKHPPIHSIMRRVVSDIPVPTKLSGEQSQYVIPKGHTVLASPLMAAHDADYWKSPFDFNPHRWLDKTQSNEDNSEKFDYGFGAVSTGAGSPYLPFGAGRHRCIGEQFAHVQIGTVIATIIRDTEWHMKDNKIANPDYASMLVGPEKTSTVVMKRRD